MFSPEALPQISTSNPNSSNKRKRNLPGTPDPDAEVIALSPKSLMAKNRFMCEICKKGFQRDQNLQLHRRGHNLPWKLRQRAAGAEIRKKVYVCPESSCVHHEPSRALGDLTGIKKHFSRKHGEKKFKCEKCCKKYAVQSDWKAHAKICGTREYKCDCGTIFSRKDSFITHRAFCDALADESARFNTTNRTFLRNATHNNLIINNGGVQEFSNNYLGTTISDDPKPPRLSLPMPLWLDANPSAGNASFMPSPSSSFPPLYPDTTMFGPWACNFPEEEKVHHIINNENNLLINNQRDYSSNQKQQSVSSSSSAHFISATALLQKAAEMGSTRSADGHGVGLMISSSNGADDRDFNAVLGLGLSGNNNSNNNCEMRMGMTRDFLGVGGNRREYFQHDLANFATTMNHYTGN